jgi:hypothetical protein
MLPSEGAYDLEMLHVVVGLPLVVVVCESGPFDQEFVVPVDQAGVEYPFRFVLLLTFDRRCRRRCLCLLRMAFSVWLKKGNVENRVNRQSRR